MADDFDAPLPDDILAGFYGEDVPEQQACQARSSEKTQEGMKYLLDTTVFLWLLKEPEKLNRRALDLLEDEAPGCVSFFRHVLGNCDQIWR